MAGSKVLTASYILDASTLGPGIAQADAELSGLDDSTAKLSEDVDGHTQDMSQAFADLGAGMGVGIGAGAGEAEKKLSDLDGAGKDLETDFDEHTSKIGDMFKGLGNSLSNFGIPFSNSLTTMGEKMDSTKAKGGSLLTTMASVGKVATVAVTAGVLAFAGASIKMSMDYQSAVDSMAASSGMSIAQASKVGAAFLDMGGKTEFTATDMVKAFGPVEAELATVQGKTLSVAQAQQVETAAANLATAGHESLTSVTSNLASVMQAYGIASSGAAKTSNVLWSTSEETGTSLSSVASMAQKLHSQMGALTPPLSQVGTLMVDLTTHGETGRQALSAVNSAMTALVKPVSDNETALTSLNNAVAGLPPNLQSLAKEYEGGDLTLAQMNDTLNGTTTATKTQTDAITAQIDQLQEQKAALTSQSAGTQANTAAITSQIQALEQQKDSLAEQAAASGTTSVAIATQTAEINKQILTLQQQASAQSTGATQSKTAITQQSDALSQQIAKLTAQKNAISASADATSTLTVSQQAAWKAFTTADAAVDSSNTKLSALGITVENSKGQLDSMGQIIAEMEPKLKGETQAQQLANVQQVFGATAGRKLLDVILAGPAAWDKDQAAVTKANAAHAAAQKASQALSVQMKILGAAIQDEGIKFGNFLIPKLEDVGRAGMDVISFLEHCKPAAIALAVVVGGPLAASMVIFAVKSLGSVVRGISNLGSKLVHLGGVFSDAAGQTSAEDVANAQLTETMTKLDAILGTVAAKLPDLTGGFESLVDVESEQFSVSANIEGSNQAVATAMDVMAEAQASVIDGYEQLNTITSSSIAGNSLLAASLSEVDEAQEANAASVSATVDAQIAALRAQLDTEQSQTEQSSKTTAANQTVQESNQALITSLDALAETLSTVVSGFASLADVASSQSEANSGIESSNASLVTSYYTVTEAQTSVATGFESLDAVEQSQGSSTTGVIAGNERLVASYEEVQGSQASLSTGFETLAGVEQSQGNATTGVEAGNQSLVASYAGVEGAQGSLSSSFESLAGVEGAQGNASSGVVTGNTMLVESYGDVEGAQRSLTTSFESLSGVEQTQGSTTTTGVQAGNDALVASYAGVEGAQGTLGASFTSLAEIESAQGDTASAIEASNAALAASYAAIDEATASTAAGLSELEAAEETFATVTEASGEEAGIGFSSMLGPIGLVIMAGTLLASHWKTVWKDVKEVGLDAWHVLDDDVWQPLVGAFDFVKKHLDEFLPAFVALAAVFAEPLVPIAVLIAAGVELVTHWKDVSHDLAAAWDGVFDTGKKVFGDLEEFFKRWGEDLLMVFAPVVGIPIFLATHWHEVLTDAENIWGDVVSFFESIPSKIMSAFTSAGTWLLGVGKDIFGGMTSGLSTGWNVVTGFFTSLPSKVASFFAGAGSWLLHAGEDILHGLWTGFEYLTPEGLIIKFHSQILAGLSDAGHWLLDAGKDVVHGLFLGFEYLTPIGLVAKFHTQILSALSGAGTWLLDIGKDIVEGLVKGIESMIDLPKKAITDVAHGVTDVAKDIWHVFSPSQVFAEIGSNLVEGLAKGISDSKQLATAAMKDVDVVSELDKELVAFDATMASVSPSITRVGAGLGVFGTELMALVSESTSARTMFTGLVDSAKALPTSLASASSGAASFDSGLLRVVTSATSADHAVDGLEAKLLPLEASITRDSAGVDTLAHSLVMGATASNELGDETEKLSVDFDRSTASVSAYGKAATATVGEVTRTMVAGFAQVSDSTERQEAELQKLIVAYDRLEPALDDVAKAEARGASQFDAFTSKIASGAAAVSDLDARTDLLAANVGDVSSAVARADTEIAGFDSTVNAVVSSAALARSALSGLGTATVGFLPSLVSGGAGLETFETDLERFAAVAVATVKPTDALDSEVSLLDSAFTRDDVALVALLSDLTRTVPVASALVGETTRMTGGFDQATASVSTFGQTTTDTASDVDHAVTSAFAEMTESGQEQQAELLQLISTYDELRQGATDVGSAETELGSQVTDLSAKYASAIDITNQATSATNTFDAALARVGSDAGEAASGVSQWANALTNADQALLAQVQALSGDLEVEMYNAGVDASQGLINGISASQSAVMQTATNVAGGAIDAMRTALGVHSPSTLTDAMGRDTVAGFVQGVLSGKSGVTSSLAEVAAAVASTSFKLPALEGVSAITGTSATGVTGAGGGAAPTGGPTTITIPITVQGSVLTDRDLVDRVYEGLVDKGLVNGSAGQLLMLRPVTAA